MTTEKAIELSPATSVAEIFISVDVETAGPTPGQYSLLSIGACLVVDPTNTFYVELQPVTDASTSEALRVSGLDIGELQAHGKSPERAMSEFSDWVAQVTPVGHQPIFVALNAAFDWMFVADYFDRYLGNNPFGHKALDIKAVFMGKHDTKWADTRYRDIAKHYQVEQGALTHNALEDALAQAELFRRILEDHT
jgi:DNA polymerase III epsilon subunit-like protein